MFSLVERIIIIIDPLRIFYGLLIVFFMYFAWRSDRPMPIIIIIRRRTNRQILVQRTQSEESEQQNETEVEELAPDNETPDMTGGTGAEEVVRGNETTAPSNLIDEADEILRAMDSNDSTDELRNRRAGSLGNSCDKSNFPEKFVETENEEFSKDSIKIKLKYLNDEIKIVRAKPNDSVGDFKKKFFSSELENDKNVKLIYYGQILSNDKTLSNYGISDETVVHCLILKNRPNSNISSGANSETVRNSNNFQERIFSHLLLDHQILLIYIGMIFVTMTLLFCWYCRIQYSYLFSPYSTIGLGLMTSLFFTMIHLLSLIER